MICLYQWFPIQVTGTWACDGLGGERQTGSSVVSLLSGKWGIILLKAWITNCSDSLWETSWGLGVIKLKNDPWVENLFRAGMQFTITSLRAEAFGQKQYFTTPPLSIQANCLPIVWQNGIFQNKGSHPFHAAQRAYESGKPASSSNLGKLKSFQILVFPPEAAIALFAPLHWKTNGGKFFEIVKTTFTGSSLFICKMISPMWQDDF